MTSTLWFMGRPASGKSTLASRIEADLREREIPVENLDGDEVRKSLHPDLGFTREDRATNNRRTAFISKLLNRNGISVVTGMITPFRESQQKAREIVEPEGEFVLIYVKCSVEECANRDPKNLYQQARQGKIENFTGVNHPFQEPHNPDIVVDTEDQTLAESVEHVRQRLQELQVFDKDVQQNYNFELDSSEEQDIKDRLSELGHID
ncbi:adenylyl-sulfate kinase [Halorussus salinisoli]|uniref:adenylyl-sulfate kinase n=1 Tax=Halorussus salinisoli TaxID=2558242 RepID=UPI0010C165D6